ncbi:MAG TPA: Ig-like domain-containing protein [Kofleriaceae bacterium]|nr:Ig-like domain-containing protein [Kofleriaceae bacterium]
MRACHARSAPRVCLLAALVACSTPSKEYQPGAEDAGMPDAPTAPQGPLVVTLVASADTATADGTSAITLTATVLRGSTPVSGQLVALNATGLDDTLSAAAGLSDANGVVSATLASTHAELKIVTATAGDASTSTVVGFVAGAPDAAHSQISASPTSVTADGTSPAIISVVVADAHGNVVANQSVSLELTGSANSLSPASGTTDATGSFTAMLRSTHEETKMVYAEIGAIEISTAVAFIAGAPSTDGSSLVADHTSAPADGATAIVLTATFYDALGNPVIDQPVALAVDGFANTLTPASGTTDGNGRIVATLASTRAEAKTVTATCNGASLTAGVVFVSGPPSVATLTATPSTVTADGVSSSVLVTAVTDAHGNPVVAQAVSLALTTGVGTLTPTSCTTASDGTCTATLQSTKAEPKAVTASIGAARASAQLQFVAGPATSLVFTPSSTSGGASNTPNVAITPHVTDAHGNPIAGVAIAITASGTNASLSASSCTTTSAGTCTVYVGSTTVQYIYVYAAATGLATATGYAQIVAGPASAATSSLAAVPNTATPDGVSAILLAMKFVDAYGNPITSTSIALAASGTATTFHQTYNFNGTFYALVTATAAQSETVSATNGGLTLTAGIAFGCTGITVASTSIPVGSNPEGSAIGDLDGDGKADVVAANLSGGLTVALGNGNGTFKTPTTYTIGSNAYAVKLVDVDGDGKLDVVVTNSSSGVGVLLNKGGGSLGTETVYGVGGAQGLVVGDFNGDHHPDVAVTSYDVVIQGATTSGVVVLLNDGHGNFATASAYATGASVFISSAVATGDLNNDGILDLVTSTVTAGDMISVLLGNGDGTFKAAVGYSGPQSAYGIALGDFNRDGYLDIAAVDEAGGSFYVYSGNGTGTFGAATTYGTNDVGMEALVAGDFDGDGYLDLAGGAINGAIYVLHGSATGAFSTGVPLATASYLGQNQLSTGDLDHDGRVDIVAANQSGAAVTAYLGHTCP